MNDTPRTDSSLTPYPEINAVARLAHAWLAEALGARLLGVYIAGSLALGDFDPITSDIDLIGVLTDAVEEADLARLTPLRAYLAERGGAWGERVEMAVISHANLAQWRLGQRLFYFTGHETPVMAAQGPNWPIVRAMLITCGLTLSGPAPSELLPTVSEREIIAAARESLRSTWANFAANPPAGWDARAYQVFIIETMCRALMTIAGGGLPSKPQALAWAATSLPHKWRSLLARAQRWRAQFTSAFDATPEPEAFPETLRFIRYAVAQTQATG